MNRPSRRGSRAAVREAAVADDEEEEEEEEDDNDTGSTQPDVRNKNTQAHRPTINALKQASNAKDVR